MGGQQKNFISDIVFFQHQDGMRKKVRRHFLQCTVDIQKTFVPLVDIKRNNQVDVQ
jgi:hypothetical protein